MPQGGGPTDSFQPAANFARPGDIPGQGRTDLNWASKLVVPVSVQVPQTAPAGNQWGSSQIINRPFIIRGVAIQSDQPKPGCYCRFGYSRDSVIDLPSQQGAFNLIQQQSRTSFSAQPDAMAMTIAGILISPIYVPVDLGQNFLWANCDNATGIVSTNLTVTFLCDFSPGT